MHDYTQRHLKERPVEVVSTVSNLSGIVSFCALLKSLSTNNKVRKKRRQRLHVQNKKASMSALVRIFYYRDYTQLTLVVSCFGQDQDRTFPYYSAETMSARHKIINPFNM